ncbi:MAG: metallophosphoesterase [Oscillospiraceae bacterium]|jgi:predicted phosphohydrolase|nr:metallophosphoesterase [Oscillospiraceae bacterium]
MALYVIGDLHLSLGTDKPMDVFGAGWDGYVEKLRKGFAHLTPDDVCVLCGDLSWARSFKESVQDFRFISELPGKKIILKGNHDHWWDTIVGMQRFFAENGFENIEILHNNCYYYGDKAICGSRGWTLEDKLDVAHNKKITRREAMRIGASLKAAGDAKEKLCFLHYPPRYGRSVCGEIEDVLLEYGVKRCWYGHIHGTGHRYAVQGVVNGIEYKMISADYIGFEPRKICD